MTRQGEIDGNVEKPEKHPNRPSCGKESDRASETLDHQVFGQQLPKQPSAARAERSADSKLALASDAPCTEYISQVETRQKRNAAGGGVGDCALGESTHAGDWHPDGGRRSARRYSKARI